jgi:HSP20 family protein
MATAKNDGGQQPQERQQPPQEQQQQRGELVGRQRGQQPMRDPFQQMLRNPFRMMREMMSDPFRWLQIPALPELAAQTGWNPDFEVRETDDAFVFKADMPGIPAEDLDISLDGNELRISGKREHEREQNEGRYHTYERSYGDFTRTFLLPDSADLDNVRSDLEDGVLSLVVPKKAGAAQQRRKIQIGSGQKD